MEVRELMTTNPFCLSVDETLQQVAQEMKRHDVGAMPVCVDDKLAGIITDRDMIVGCVAEGKQPQQSVVKDHMTADPICIGVSATPEQALEVMARSQVRRRLCVTEDGTEDGNLVGMLALGDLAHHFMDNARISETLAAISEPFRRL
ncbi:MAG TPA: CBS domain-containing protein [Dehalococcoidia bacterium]|nr:CBS domain-containing protein [Dehalococcoidia bacterium]